MHENVFAFIKGRSIYSQHFRWNDKVIFWKYLERPQHWRHQQRSKLQKVWMEYSLAHMTIFKHITLISPHTCKQCTGTIKIHSILCYSGPCSVLLLLWNIKLNSYFKKDPETYIFILRSEFGHIWAPSALFFLNANKYIGLLKCFYTNLESTPSRIK